METPVRILQRPCQSSENNSLKHQKPAEVKSLEQRAKDYYAARQRIMGTMAPEENETGDTALAATEAKDVTPLGKYADTSVNRHGPISTNCQVASATPLMSVQTNLNQMSEYRHEFQPNVETTSCFSGYNAKLRNAASATRLGPAMKRVPNQQFRSAMNGTRSIPQHQSLAPSNSSPALYTHDPTANVPFLPTHVNNTSVARMPFFFPMPPDNVLNSLASYGGLLKQWPQQPNGGYQHSFPSYPNNVSVDYFNFAIPPAFSSNSQQAHQPTFN